MNTKEKEFQCYMQNVVEQNQTPLLCFYVNQLTQKVHLMSDSESVRQIRESKTILEIEKILSSTFEGKKNLNFSNLIFDGDKQSCQKGVHKCHLPQPKFQLSWEKSDLCYLNESKPMLVDARIGKLPPEILRNIFGYLKPAPDLKNMLLVSKYWKSVAEDPLIWSGFEFPAKCHENEQALQTFFEGNLFSKVQHLVLREGYRFTLNYFKLNDGHFKKFLSLDITEITINNIDLTDVSDDLFAKLVNSCKECKIRLWSGRNILESKKLVALFDVMRKETKLKTFALVGVGPVGFFDLSPISPHILAQAFSKLESLRLNRVQFGENQLKTICQILPGSLNLKYLELKDIDPKSDLVSMNLLDAVLTNLKGFSYEPTVLNNPYERLMELVDKSCKLKSLTLDSFNLKEVPPKLLARVLNKLECLDLTCVAMSEEQTKEVFRVMSSGTCLKKFDFIEFVDHIEKVDPVILAKALNNLEFLRVDFPSPITLPQILAIFKQLNVKTRIKAIVRYPPYEDLMGDDEFLYL